MAVILTCLLLFSSTHLVQRELSEGVYEMVNVTNSLDGGISAINVEDGKVINRLFVTDNSKAKTTLVLDIHSGKVLKAPGDGRYHGRAIQC